MANQVYANNASAVLASGITDSATTITVASGQGASFPTVSGGNWAYITLVDTSGNLEIVKCTSHLPASDTFTCTRGQDGTTARAFSANDLFELRVTKATLDTLRDIMSSTSGSASGLESIGFATSGSGACLYTSSTGPTRKILSNSGSGSYYAMGTSPYVMFKTGISFTENTSAEPGTLVFSMSATSVSCSAPTFTAQAITASGAVTQSSTNSGGTNTMTVKNNSNTASSVARQLIQTGGTSAGDAYTGYYDGTNLITVGTKSGDTTLYYGSDGPSGTVRAVLTSGKVFIAGGGTTATSNGGSLETNNGITFPATQSACSNANTLDDYEEGTWTATDNSADALTLTLSGCKYQKVGNRVTIAGKITYPAVGGTGIPALITLPITAAATAAASSVIVTDAGVSTGLLVLGGSSTTSLFIKNPTSAAAINNSALAGKTMYVLLSYEAA